jgi:hypothetical protein
MQDTNDLSPARPGRRRTGIAVAVIGATVAAGALLTIGRSGGGEPASAAPPVPAVTDDPTPNTEPAREPAGPHMPPTSVATPASPTPAAAPAAPEREPEPEPVMADGRHPVFLTDLDVDGGTVEFDLLQYLTGAEEEAYQDAHPHPTHPGGCGCDDHSGPLHNDNPRLRRLPIASDLPVLVQGSTTGMCDGAHPTTFDALISYLTDDGGHDYEPGTGHLGSSAFWLTVDHDTVTDIEEVGCAG